MSTTTSPSFIREAQALGIPFGDRTREALNSLQNPVHRVAVIGDFQVGKTTLINKVFLKNEVLLTEGDGMLPTSSVCTRVAYGPEKKLTVIPRKTKTEKVTVGSEQIGITVPDAPGVPQVFANPTAEQFRQLGCASDDEGRTKLAATTEELRLEWPAEPLKNYEIFDTPGLNDTNGEMLMHTTYRVVPQVDLVILVVEPKQLAQNVLQFLAGSVFKNGIAQAVVLISCKPQKDTVVSAQMEKLAETIKDQLDVRGLSVPVAAYTFDASVALELNSPDKIENWLHARLAERTQAAKMQKAANLLRVDLSLASEQLRNTIALAGNEQQAKRTELAQELEKSRKDLPAQHARIWLNIRAEAETLAQAKTKSATSAIEAIEAQWAQKVDQATDFGQLKTIANDLQVDLPNEIHDLTSGTLREMESEIFRQVSAHTELDQLPMAAPAPAPVTPPKIGGVYDTILKASPWMITTADVVITSVLLPGGLVSDILGRVVLPNLPVIGTFLGKWTPTAVLNRALQAKITGAIHEVTSEVNRQTRANIATVATQMCESLEQALAQNRDARIKGLEQSLADAANAGTPAQVLALRQKLDRVESVLAMA